MENTETEKGLPGLNDNARFLGEKAGVSMKNDETGLILRRAPALTVQHGVFAGETEQIGHVTGE
jgi:hypothetical protein